VAAVLPANLAGGSASLFCKLKKLIELVSVEVKAKIEANVIFSVCLVSKRDFAFPEREFTAAVFRFLIESNSIQFF
jgi:hypothetical protein